MNGFMIAAPSSGSGKTVITLGLLRALKNRGIAISSGKAGPDFIDPQFHAIAAGRACFNFDPWAMRRELLIDQRHQLCGSNHSLVVEAMMGLFDGAADGTGSAGDLAAMLGLPVILIIDCSKLSHSVAAIVSGFATFRDEVNVSGIILNKVASDRHEKMLRHALSEQSVKVLGALHRSEELKLPERHLGLVQANEHLEIEQFIERAAERIEQQISIDELLEMLRPCAKLGASYSIEGLPPLGQKIAVARDIAFAFTYEHMLHGWRKNGAEITFFSPLNDEVPASDADAIYLPGGYPELHAEKISQAANFQRAMAEAATMGKHIYGECGGYMVLGDAIIDADGKSHQMLGLLPLETSFARRKRQLGYRKLTPHGDWIWRESLRAHEFHYSTVQKSGEADPLFSACDAEGNAIGDVGMRRDNVAGSYMHVIDRA